MIAKKKKSLPQLLQSIFIMVSTFESKYGFESPKTAYTYSKKNPKTLYPPIQNITSLIYNKPHPHGIYSPQFNNSFSPVKGCLPFL